MAGTEEKQATTAPTHTRPTGGVPAEFSLSDLTAAVAAAEQSTQAPAAEPLATVLTLNPTDQQQTLAMMQQLMQENQELKSKEAKQAETIQGLQERLARAEALLQAQVPSAPPSPGTATGAVTHVTKEVEPIKSDGSEIEEKNEEKQQEPIVATAVQPIVVASVAAPMGNAREEFEATTFDSYTKLLDFIQRHRSQIVIDDTSCAQVRISELLLHAWIDIERAGSRVIGSGEGSYIFNSVEELLEIIGACGENNYEVKRAILAWSRPVLTVNTTQAFVDFLRLIYAVGYRKLNNRIEARGEKVVPSEVYSAYKQESDEALKQFLLHFCLFCDEMLTDLATTNNEDEFKELFRAAIKAQSKLTVGVLTRLAPNIVRFKYSVEIGSDFNARKFGQGNSLQEKAELFEALTGFPAMQASIFRIFAENCSEVEEANWLCDSVLTSYPDLFISKKARVKLLQQLDETSADRLIARIRVRDREEFHIQTFRAIERFPALQAKYAKSCLNQFDIFDFALGEYYANRFELSALTAAAASFVRDQQQGFFSAQERNRRQRADIFKLAVEYINQFLPRWSLLGQSNNLEKDMLKTLRDKINSKVLVGENALLVEVEAIITHLKSDDAQVEGDEKHKMLGYMYVLGKEIMSRARLTRPPINDAYNPDEFQAAAPAVPTGAAISAPAPMLFEPDPDAAHAAVERRRCYGADAAAGEEDHRHTVTASLEAFCNQHLDKQRQVQQAVSVPPVDGSAPA